MKQGRKPYRLAEVKLEEILYVDASGILRWKVKWGKMRANDPAGRVYGDGRFMVKIRGKFVLVEDIAWLLTESHSNSPETDLN
jgi:hypothetical protein